MTASDDKEKKEKVIHTRISESLDEEIRERASRLGLSVSNLVRNVLLNTFGLVEDIVADSANIARSAKKESNGTGRRPSSSTGGASAEERASNVLGWQEVILSRNAVCATCNTILKKGTRAGIAITEGSGPKTILCATCLEQATSREEE